MMFCLSSARSIAHTLKHLGAAALLATLAACGDGGGSGADAGVPQYTIGGSVSGLSGAGLVLRNNATDSLAVPTAGNFSFATRIAAGSTYAVTVATQPAGQTCTVANAVGTASANVSNVTVACTTNTEPPPPPPSTRAIGGSVTALTGAGLVLHNNGGNDLAVTANGSFAFSVRVPVGMPYAVTVATQPSAQQCAVANGSGTTAAADISNITVACIGVNPPPPPPGSFSISGLTTAGLVLQNNGAERLTIAANATSFSFAIKVTAGGAYNVRIATQPGVTGSAQDCTVASGSGNAQADISTVRVSCGPMGPLTLLGSDPADGATAVARNVRPTLNFSSPLDASTVTNGRLSLSTLGDSTTGTIPFTSAVTGSQINLTPTTKLLPLKRHFFSGSLGICGLRNECLEGPQPWLGFTTADNTWKDVLPASGTERPLDRTNSKAVALDDDGNALAAWRVAGKAGVRISRFNAASGAWGGSRLISGEPDTPGKLRLQMDAAGNALLVWEHQNTATPAYRVIWAADTQQRKWLKRRQAIEPAIGHTKSDNRMDRCWLSGSTGDALHAVLCAAGFNIRWLMRAIAAKGLAALLLAFSQLALYAARIGHRLCAPTSAAVPPDRPIVWPPRPVSQRLATG